MNRQIRIVLLFLAFHVFALNSIAQHDTVSFLHISDTHLIFNLGLYQSNLAQSRQHYGYGVDSLKQFLKTVPRKTNSDMVAATGDLIDFYEGETIDGNMQDLMIKQFVNLLDKSKTPVLLTLGNHDISSYSWGDSTRVSSQNHAGQARATWIRNAPCFSEGTYYSKILVAGKTTFRLIFLDDAYNSVHPGENTLIPYIDKAQLHWLENELMQSDNDIEILLMHLPITSGVTLPEHSCELYAVLAKNPSVKLILAGHNHRNAIRDFTTGDNQKITQVQTGAFGQSTKNWRRICLTENSILVSLPGSSGNELTIPVN